MNQELEKPEKPVSPFKDRRVQGLIAVAVVAAFLVGMVLDEKLWRRQAVWGDIPTWLLAVGGFAAAGIALIQLNDLRGQVADDAKRNRKRDELMDKQIAEAERREKSERRRLVEGVEVVFNRDIGRVMNNSKRPINDVTCKVMSKVDRHSLVTPSACGEVIFDGHGWRFPGGSKPV